MAASSTEIPKPATVTEICTARTQDREAQPTDEKRMLAALEEIADTSEAIRQEIVHFESLVERFLLAQRAQHHPTGAVTPNFGIFQDGTIGVLTPRQMLALQRTINGRHNALKQLLASGQTPCQIWKSHSRFF